jgi:hypothetical protein
VFSNTNLLIQDELKNIDDLFAEYELLFDLAKQQEPDSVETLALAAVVHSFYNGLENIFQLIAKRVDSYAPKPPAWHTDLLLKMGEATNKRKAVLQETTLSDLQEYLGFRHFFRHSYTYKVEWVKLQPLIDNIHETWDKVKIEIEAFIKTIES